MLELGDGSIEYHRRLAEHCGGIERVVCVGQGMNALWHELPESQRLLRAERAAEVPLKEVVAELAPGDVVLVKGSNRVFWANNFVKRLRGRDRGALTDVRRRYARFRTTVHSSPVLNCEERYDQAENFVNSCRLGLPVRVCEKEQYEAGERERAG